MRGAGLLIEQELRSLKATQRWLGSHSRKQQQRGGSAAGAQLPSEEGSTHGGQAAVAAAAWPSAAVASVAAGANTKAVAGVVVTASALMQRLGVPVPEEVATAAQQLLVDRGLVAAEAAPANTEDISVKVISRSSSPGDTLGRWMSAAGSGGANPAAGSSSISSSAAAGGDDDLKTELALHAHIYASLWNAIIAMERWSSAMGRWHGKVIEDMNGWLLRNGAMLLAHEGSTSLAVTAAAQGAAMPPGSVSDPGDSAGQGSMQASVSGWTSIPMVQDVDRMLAVGGGGGLSEALQQSLWAPPQPAAVSNDSTAAPAALAGAGSGALADNEQVKSSAMLLLTGGATGFVGQNQPSSDSDGETEEVGLRGAAHPPRLLVADSLRFSKGAASSPGDPLDVGSSSGSSWVATPGAISIRGPSALRMGASMAQKRSGLGAVGVFAGRADGEEDDPEGEEELEGGVRGAASSSGFDSSDWVQPLSEDVNRALEESTAGAAAAAAAGIQQRDGTSFYAWGSVTGGSSNDGARSRGSGARGRSAAGFMSPSVVPHPPEFGRPSPHSTVGRPRATWAAEGSPTAESQGHGKRVVASSPGA